MWACSKCGKNKEETAFSYRDKAKEIRHVQCKSCIKINTSRHYDENKEEYKNRVKNWVKNNNTQKKRNARNSYAINKGYERCDCCKEEDINQFLENCPEGCEVDHIKNIRQQGKHCLKNIRYLTVSCHRRRSQWERYNT